LVFLKVIASAKKYYGFQTGDIIKAIIPKGKHVGSYIGAVAVRASGYFDIKNVYGHVLAQGVKFTYCKLLQRGDGYMYS